MVEFMANESGGNIVLVGIVSNGGIVSISIMVSISMIESLKVSV